MILGFIFCLLIKSAIFQNVDVSDRELWTNMTKTEEQKPLESLQNIGNVANNVNNVTKASATESQTDTAIDNTEIKIATFLANNTANGRRYLGLQNPVFAQIDYLFRNVENKLKSLSTVKIALSNVSSYRIGYLTANLDTLEVALKKLKAEKSLNEHYWTSEKVYNYYQRLNVTVGVIETLLKSLDSIIDNRNVARIV